MTAGGLMTQPSDARGVLTNLCDFTSPLLHCLRHPVARAALPITKDSQRQVIPEKFRGWSRGMPKVVWLMKNKIGSVSFAKINQLFSLIFFALATEPLMDSVERGPGRHGKRNADALPQEDGAIPVRSRTLSQND